MKSKIWIALGMLLFAVLLVGLYWWAGQMGVNFTEPSG